MWVGVVVTTLLLATGTLGQPVAFPVSGAAGWLPADGSRQRYAGPTGTVATEWALDRAVGLVGSGPPAFSTWLGLTSLDWTTVAVARLAAVASDSTGLVTGRTDTLFSDDATALIHQTSRGYPRAVNNLAVQALTAAYAGGKAIVDENAARAAVTEVTTD